MTGRSENNTSLPSNGDRSLCRRTALPRWTGIPNGRAGRHHRLCPRISALLSRSTGQCHHLDLASILDEALAITEESDPLLSSDEWTVATASSPRSPILPVTTSTTAAIGRTEGGDARGDRGGQDDNSDCSQTWGQNRFFRYIFSPLPIQDFCRFLRHYLYL